MEFKVIVCIKPIAKELRLSEDGLVIRKELDINPYDLSAVELGLTIKEKIKNKCVKIICVSMGPQEAYFVLKKAIWMGVDFCF